MTLTLALRLAGLAQLALAAGSLAIPRILRWTEETARLRPLLRQLFWIYGAYILGSHVAFGLVSTLAAPHLVDGSPLAACVTAFIAAWWIARLSLQVTVLDRKDFPTGRRFLAAEAALVALFVALILVYGAAVAANLRT